jgi:hypothetical protein
VQHGRAHCVMQYRIEQITPLSQQTEHVIRQQWIQELAEGSEKGTSLITFHQRYQ